MSTHENNLVELLVDGGFDNGSGWSGNAFNIVDGVSHADVELAGNAWDKPSGDVTLVAGELYTVQFVARGTEGRTTLAGIGDTTSASRGRTTPRYSPCHQTGRPIRYT